MLRCLALLLALYCAACQAILGITNTREGAPAADAAITDAARIDGAEDAAIVDVAIADVALGDAAMDAIDAPVAVDGPSAALDAAGVGFSISINPVAIHVVRGGPPVGATVTVTRSAGFTGDVAFTVTGVPTSVTASGTTVMNPATSGALTFSAGGDAPLGPVTVTLAGDSGAQATFSFQILVTDAAGALDQTFNQTGSTSSQPLGAASYSQAAALVRPDGRIVVFGTVNTGVGGDAVGSTAVVQLGADGQPDSQFGTGGVTIIDHFGATHMALGPSGEVVLAGFNGADTRTTFVRLQPSGVVDSSLGGAGGSADAGLVAGEVIDGRAFEPSGVVVQSTGAIVYVHHLQSLEVPMTLVCRLTAVGLNNTTFGISGCWESSTQVPYLDGIAVSSNYDLFLGGTNGQSGSEMLYTVHLDPNGNMSHEAVFPAATGKFYMAGAALDGAHTLVVGAQTSGTETFGAVGRGGDSGVDTSFKGFGYVLADPGGLRMTSFTAVVEQPDGSVVAVGSTATAAQVGGCAVRFSNFGAADAGFGAGGLVFFPDVQTLSSVAVAPDGRLVVLGIEASGSLEITRLWQ